jgi:hypothetical protein
MSFIRPTVYEAGLPRKARAGDGWLAFPQKTNQTTNSNQVISVSAILGGLYVRSGTNTNRTDTTDIATAILAAMPEMNIGSVYMFMVANQTANTLVIAGGTGVTASGSLSVLTLTTKWFMLTKTSDTTMTLEGF